MSFPQTLETLDLTTFTGANPNIRSDRGAVFEFTGPAPLTKIIDAPIAGFSNHVWVKNSTAFILTLDPDGFNIDGLADLAVPANAHFHLLWTGTTWITI